MRDESGSVCGSVAWRGVHVGDGMSAVMRLGGWWYRCRSAERRRLYRATMQGKAISEYNERRERLASQSWEFMR